MGHGQNKLHNILETISASGNGQEHVLQMGDGENSSKPIILH